MDGGNGANNVVQVSNDTEQDGQSACVSSFDTASQEGATCVLPTPCQTPGTDNAFADDKAANSSKFATAFRGLRRGIVGQFVPKVSFELVVIGGVATMSGTALSQGIGLRPAKSASAAVKVMTSCEESESLNKMYNWRQLPRWWHLSLYMCIAAYVACLMWDVATLFPSAPAYAALQGISHAFLGGVTFLLHHLEGRWFARWHAAQVASHSAHGISKVSSQCKSPIFRQPIWPATIIVAFVGGAVAGILVAESMVFASPAAMEDSPTGLIFGYLPNVVIFKKSTIVGLAYITFILGVTYKFYHGVLPYLLLPTSELPGWLLPVLVWDVLMGWFMMMVRFMPYPGDVYMAGFGYAWLAPIHDMYRVVIRGVRLWGLPTEEWHSDYPGRLLMLSSLFLLSK